MQVGQTKFGMQTMNQSLFSLYERHLITLEETMDRSHNPEELRQMISNAGLTVNRRERPLKTA
jgi:twitching motility protein PilT